MKKIVLFTVVLGSLCLSFRKEKSFIPPGTVQINDTLFADETEISNFSWREYEWWISAKYGVNSKEHIAALPDTMVWKETLSYNDPYVKHYYRHPAYKNYPVVGISYEQAVDFCKWRTDRVKMFLTRKKDFTNQNFEYRLPTKAEWERLAETSASFLSNNGKDKKGTYQLNCVNPLLNGDCLATGTGDLTSPVKSYEKNFLELYNLLGNVAEMVNEKGISKGGGWKNKLEECRAGKDSEYTKPTAWLGFRCVCVVKNS
jgi:formylglycine-generating enzyme required for sulfatase activity